ncbi:DUF3019 domain-containing protein [uncultured Paraglaciecola sp.]|uniref:DUF3019 domain-containing protein n=1 Tax=uncultured Paraglaciecola sp. TaxID=1765024 RepID=UPI00345B7DE1
MDLRIAVLITGVIWCSQICAQTPVWTIQPNTCVAKRLGDTCQLTFSIETEDLPPERLCLFLEGKLLSCSQQSHFYKETSISITQNSLLELKNMAQQTILSKTLMIKYLEPHAQRRRIRPPWSLF